MTNLRNHLQMLATITAGIASAAVIACGGSARTTDTTSGSTSPTLLSSAVASSTAAAGTMLCTPSQGQVAACTGLAAGASCTLTTTTPSGTVDVAGTCRAGLDGTTVACAPNPPAPPQELVTACNGLTAGAACTVTEAMGDTRSGTCVTARDSTTLVCGRVHTPPQPAIDACASLTAGAACTMTGPNGAGTLTGICSLGPASTGPLACAPPRDLLPNGQAACTGLAAGATCTLGHGHESAAGTCVIPTGETAAVCVVPCADLGGRFQCDGPGGHEGPGGPGGPSGPMGPSGPSGPMGPGQH